LANVSKNEVICELANPTKAVLRNDKGIELSPVSTDLRGDYFGQHLRVAVRQRFANPTSKTQRVFYSLPLGESDTLYDFRVMAGDKTKFFDDVTFKKSNRRAGHLETDLGYQKPGGELSVVYVYSRFTEINSDNRVSFHIGASEDEPDAKTTESVGFFLRGDASLAEISSLTTHMFVDKLDKGNVYVCPNDELVLNFALSRFAEENREKLENGSMHYDELFDFCPANINPVFHLDFILTLDNVRVGESDFMNPPDDVKGEVIANAVTGEPDPSKEFVRTFFLNVPSSPVLPPMAGALYRNTRTSEPADGLELTASERAELLELFDDTARNNLKLGGAKGRLTLMDVLLIVINLVPEPTKRKLWDMNFDQLCVNETDEKLWALRLADYLKSNGNGEKHETLETLAAEVVNGMSEKAKTTLRERLALAGNATVTKVMFAPGPKTFS
jgi:hypothetical protein